jgi:hypothetical protein
MQLEDQVLRNICEEKFSLVHRTLFVQMTFNNYGLPLKTRRNHQKVTCLDHESRQNDL